MTDENLKPLPSMGDFAPDELYLHPKHGTLSGSLDGTEVRYTRAQEPTGDAAEAEAIRTLGNGMEDYGMPEEPSWRAHLKTLSDFVNQSPAAENAIPPGFALVPLEPTEAMRAAWNSHPGNDESYFSPLFYKAMIAAAGETK